MSKWTTLTLIAGVVIAGWFVYDYLTDSQPVSAAEVSIGSISEFVDERAKTRLPRTYLITMPYDGRLEPITLREGDQVRKDGDPVARLVLPDIDLKVQAAQRVVERLEAAVKESEDKTVEETAEQQAGLFVAAMAETVKAANERVKAGEKKDTVAQSRYARVEDLFGDKVATQEELELAELAMVESNVDYRQDQSVLNAVQAMLAATKLIPEMVREVSSLGVEQQRVKVIVAIDNADLTRLLDKQKLGVDYQVRVKIFTAHKDNAILIPRSAIFRGDNGQWQAYAVKDGRAQLAQIKIGLENDDVVEVIDGLGQGDTVIVAPEAGLESGQRVDARIKPLTHSLEPHSLEPHSLEPHSLEPHSLEPVASQR